MGWLKPYRLPNTLGFWGIWTLKSPMRKTKPQQVKLGNITMSCEDPLGWSFGALRILTKHIVPFNESSNQSFFGGFGGGGGGGPISSAHHPTGFLIKNTVCLGGFSSIFLFLPYLGNDKYISDEKPPTSCEHPATNSLGTLWTKPF